MSSANVKTNDKTGGSRLLRRLLPLLLALGVMLALLPGAPARAEYYDEAIQKLMGWGVLLGYPDGSLNPDSDITRAEFVALINRAYGYDETTAIPFTDVSDSAWYRDDIAAAYAASYFTGTTPTTATPEGQLTREQAMVLLGRNMRLEETAGEVTSFSDGRAFQSYSAGYANTASEKGLVSGYEDGSFRPANSITRGEMAVMLARALGSLVNESGTYSLGDTYGNVTINTPGATLRDTTIAGDLYLTGGIGLGGVTLENVRVLGDIIVAGGGESNSGESVILRNVTADNVVVDTLGGQYVSLRAEGDTNVANALLSTDAYLQDRTAAGLGFQNIYLEDTGGIYTLSGNLGNVTNLAPYSTLRVSQGTVQNLTMDESAPGASLWLDDNATVLNLNLDTATAVEGRGDVEKLNVNVPGTSTQMLPDTIEIRPGVTSVIAGTNMDAEAGREASSDPRLIAGYPRVSNIAATTATAAFSTNKAGTVYWALTAISDGSVNEEALLTPSSKAAILKSGNLRAAQSNTVYTAALTGLTSGGSYYLSAMLVDARGDYSPVKVVSFTTADDSVPAFGSGYPYMVEPVKASEGAWASVMATKDCQLYWVVYDAGSAAPTANSFRAGALAGSYGSGIVDMTKNSSETLKVNTRSLAELKNYDVYFWLNDADNAKSSAVKKLSFTTVDETPPKFNTAPYISSVEKTQLKATFNLDEACTIYWVAVLNSTADDYPADKTYTKTDGNYTGTDEATKIKIANLNGATAGSGSVSAKAGTDATVTVSRLAEATRYTIFYVARDAAGNYTGTWGGLTQSTVDETAPSVSALTFSRYFGDDTTRPFADTNITITFDELVQRYYYDYAETAWVRQPFLELYEATVDSSKSEEQKAEAREEMAGVLRETIQLYYQPVSGQPELVKERNKDNESDTDWVIDYRYVTMSRNPDSGALSVVFPTNVSSPSTSALNLSSGASYYFVIQDIADTYDTPNRMGTTRPDPDPFTTIDAEVYLAEPSASVTSFSYGGKTLEADIVFDMFPSSIEKADASQTWDMFLWADTGVTFELYGRTRSTATANAAYGPWEPKGTATIGFDAGDAGVTYKGTSYIRDILKEDSNPSITDAEKGLKDNTDYQFAIHITQIGDNAERTTWSRNVTFWVTVDTGSSNNLGILHRTMTDRYYATMLGTLKEISTPENFTLTVPFSDTVAPYFIDGYPAITPDSKNARLAVKLNRPGTVYWVVAPAGYEVTDSAGNVTATVASVITTTRRYSSAATLNGVYEYARDTAILYDDHDVPLSGNNQYNDANRVAFYNADGSEVDRAPYDDWYPTYLASPTASSVYNPRFNNSAILTGYFDADETETVIDFVTAATETGRELDPQTRYFLYLVLKGSSSVYSDYAQVFEFQTTEVTRPILRLDAEQNIVINLESNIGATADYTLFDLSDTVMPSVLSRNFETYALTSDPELAAAFRALPEYATLYKDYTVLQAMATDVRRAGGGIIGSLFDIYASETYKNSCANVLRSTTSPSSGIIYAESNKSLNRTDTIDYSNQALYPLVESTRYYGFVAIARDSAAEDANGHSLAFRAYYPIYRRNTAQPSITGVSYNLTGTYNNRLAGNFSISGSITINFDMDLYTYYVDPQGNITHRGVDNAPKDASGRNDSFVSVGTLRDDVNSAAGFTVNANGTVNTNIRRITLKVDGVLSGEKIFLNADGNLSSLYSNPVADLLTVTLTAKVGDSQGTVTVGDGHWATTSLSGSFYLDNPITPNITLNQSSIDIIKEDKSAATEDQRTVTATLSPEGTAALVNWRLSPTGVAKFADGSGTLDDTYTTTEDTGHSVTLVGYSFGETTLTATMVVSGQTVDPATCAVTVSAYSLTLNDPSGTGLVDGQDNTKEHAYLYSNGVATLTADAYLAENTPNAVGNGDLSWTATLISSSAEGAALNDVLSVASSGGTATLTGKGTPGVVLVTVSAGSKSASCRVEVTETAKPGSSL